MNRGKFEALYCFACCVLNHAEMDEDVMYSLNSIWCTPNSILQIKQMNNFVPNWCKLANNTETPLRTYYLTL